MTTVAEEVRFNPRLGAGMSKEQFVELMRKKFDGSNYPGKIDEVLPRNLLCGAMP